jgi:hypothetical protein
VLADRGDDPEHPECGAFVCVTLGHLDGMNEPVSKLSGSASFVGHPAFFP